MTGFGHDQTSRNIASRASRWAGWSSNSAVPLYNAIADWVARTARSLHVPRSRALAATAAASCPGWQRACTSARTASSWSANFACNALARSESWTAIRSNAARHRPVATNVWASVSPFRRPASALSHGWRSTSRSSIRTPSRWTAPVIVCVRATIRIGSAGRTPAERDLAAPLGAARAQVHNAYILAQTADGLVIVDQHAAHERIVYETLKRQREGRGIERQTLLSPLVVDLDSDAAARIEAHADELASLGLVVEGFGPGAVMVREAPAAIAQGDLTALLGDLASDLAAEDGALSLARRLDQRLATFACHHSVRFGRTLKPEEMNALLRQMEATPGAGQCNHGRPTYVELKLADIERLFGRR